MPTREQKASRQQEERAAESLGGQVQKGSGSHWAAKGDVRVMGQTRLECKTTRQKFYSLKFKDLEKIRREALFGGDQEWAFQIQFQGPVGMHQKFAVIDWNVVATMETDMSSFHREKALGKSFSFSVSYMGVHPRVVLSWPDGFGHPKSVAIMLWDLYINTPRREN